jgi:hypothetical protein
VERYCRITGPVKRPRGGVNRPVKTQLQILVRGECSTAVPSVALPCSTEQKLLSSKTDEPKIDRVNF